MIDPGPHPEAVPAHAGTNVACQRSRPGLVAHMGTSTHPLDSGGRCSSTTRSQSWPSANTVASTVTGSPTTRLTG